LAGLLHPGGEPSFLELVVLADAEVADFLATFADFVDVLPAIVFPPTDRLIYNR
jgi:hypothetical protein